MTNKEAIEQLKQIPINPEASYEYMKTIYSALDLAIKALEERPQGEWIDTGDMEEYWGEEYQCSICGAKDHWHRYCPRCGADMRGGKE